MLLAPVLVLSNARAPTSSSISKGIAYPPTALASSVHTGGIVDVTKVPFNADNTGTKDATAALVAAYNSVWLPTNCSGTGDPPSVDCLTSVNQRILYFPPGVYRLTGPLEFTVDR